MCVLGKKEIINKVLKAERIDDLSKDLFFSTDCKILYEKNSKKSGIMIVTRKINNKITVRKSRSFL